MAVFGTAPQPAGTGNFDIVLIAFTHAIVLFVLVRSLGAASGAHFNPAVTIALLFKLGALAAAVLYTQIVLGPQERTEQRPIDTLS